MLRGRLKNINLIVVGRGYAGDVAEFDPPKLALAMDEDRPGGLDAAVKIPMGMEPLMTSFTMLSVDGALMRRWGLGAGQRTPLELRGALEGDGGIVQPVVYALEGDVSEVDPGTWKPGEKTNIKYTVELRYYKLTVGGVVEHEIDIPNMIRIIGGVDQLAAQREALNL
ncbi:MAG: phage major tail tube protein [Rhodospirillales bacterium]|nr:phage major tail tube protein [Rhodospirillales bacterium]